MISAAITKFVGIEGEQMIGAATLNGAIHQCALSIIFPTGAYAPDSEERLWDVARAVKDELTPVRTAEGLSTVFSGRAHRLEQLWYRGVAGVQKLLGLEDMDAVMN
jgi:hypothetical protein